MIDPASRYGRRFFPMHELDLHVAGVYVELFVQLIVSKTKGLQRYTALLVQRKKPPWVHDPGLPGRIAALTPFAHFLSESDGRPICEVEWWNSGGWFGLGAEMEESAGNVGEGDMGAGE